MCVCPLSLFLSLSFFLPLSLLSLRSGGSNVCYFFYTWPCLFGRTYQRRLVGASLPLPALHICLVRSSLVQCLQTALRFYLFIFILFLIFSSLWISICSLSHDRHGWTCTLSLPFFFFPSVFLHHFLSLCALPAPPAPLVLFEFRAPNFCPQILQTAPYLCVCVFGAQVDELGKVILLPEERMSEGKSEQRGRRKQTELNVWVRGRNWLYAACLFQLLNPVFPLVQ